MGTRSAAIAIGLLVASAPALAGPNASKPAVPAATTATAHGSPAKKPAAGPARVAATSATAEPGRDQTGAMPRGKMPTAPKGVRAAALPPSYAAIPEARRRAIQAALALLDDFDAADTKNRDTLTVAAAKAFQQRHGGKETGVLTDDEFAALTTAARAREEAVGWRVFDDAATGARIGLPLKLLPQASAAPTGSRWSSAKGQIQVETFRLHEASLPALFDDQRKPARHRAVDLSELEPDSFVISGMQGLKEFITRVEAGGSELRGVTVLYDQATEGTMAALALAVADTFRGFPDAAADPGMQRSVEYGTAIVVSSRGHLIAPARLAGDCHIITVPGLGHAERIAVDKAAGLVLLRLYGAQGLTPAALGGDRAATDTLTLVGIADPLAQGGGGAVSHAAAQSTAQGLDPAPKLGFAGAAAVDGQGRLAGMAELTPPLVAGVNAGATAKLVPADAMRSFLQAQGIAPASGCAPIDQSVVRLICVRQ